MQNDINISAKIKELQRIKKKTQKDIAEHTKLSVTGLQKMIKKNDFRISFLINIAEILDVPIGYFFSNMTLDDFINNENTQKEELKTLIGTIDKLEKENIDIKNRLLDKTELVEFWKYKYGLMEKAAISAMEENGIFLDKNKKRIDKNADELNKSLEPYKKQEKFKQ